MNIIIFLIISCIIYFKSFTYSKLLSNNERILHELSKQVNQAQEFKEIYNLTKDEISKFKDLKKGFPNDNNYTHDRFTQMGEPANEAKIRESLYVTQLKRSTPQSRVSIEVKENVDDVVKNSSNLVSLTENPEENYFEDELHRMKMEEISKKKIKSLEVSLTIPQLKFRNKLILWRMRLIKPKDSIISLKQNVEIHKNEEPVAKVICDA